MKKQFINIENQNIIITTGAYEIKINRKLILKSRDGVFYIAKGYIFIKTIDNQYHQIIRCCNIQNGIDIIKYIWELGCKFTGKYNTFNNFKNEWLKYFVCNNSYTEDGIYDTIDKIEIQNYALYLIYILSELNEPNNLINSKLFIDNKEEYTNLKKFISNNTNFIARLIFYYTNYYNKECYRDDKKHNDYKNKIYQYYGITTNQNDLVCE